MNWAAVITFLQSEAKHRYRDVSNGKFPTEMAAGQVIVADVLFALSGALARGMGYIQDESDKDARAEPADDASVGDGEAVDIQRP